MLIKQSNQMIEEWPSSQCEATWCKFMEKENVHSACERGIDDHYEAFLFMQKQNSET